MIKIEATDTSIDYSILENSIKVLTRNINDIEIHERLKLVRYMTKSNDLMWATDYSWIEKRRFSWLKIRYQREEYNNIILLEYEKNYMYFGPKAIGGYMIEYEKGKTISRLANMIVVLYKQFLKYENRRFVITLDLVNDTKLEYDEPEIELSFFEVRDEYKDTYNKICRESMINIYINT